jgi:hypothetical protein
VFTEPLPNNDKRDTHSDTQSDERDLRSTPLRWAQVPRCTYKIPQKLVQAFKIDGGMHRHTDKMEIAKACLEK